MLRVGAVLVTVVCLSGCAGQTPVSNPEAESDEGVIAGLFARKAPDDGAGAADAPTRPQLPTPLQQVSLAGGDVVVKAPDGYCIDPITADSRPQRGFAMIASCRILSGGAMGRPVSPMLTTVTVGAKAREDSLPSAAEIADGAALPLVGGVDAADFVAANLGQGGDVLLSGGDRKHWRAVFHEGGRLVGLALYAPEGSALTGGDGADMLRKVRASITSGAPDETAAARETTRAGASNREGGLLGRLFNRQDLP